MRIDCKISNINITDFEADMFDIGVDVTLADSNGKIRRFSGYTDEDCDHIHFTHVVDEIFDDVEMTYDSESRITEALKPELKEAAAWAREYINTKLRTISKLKEIAFIGLTKEFCKKTIDVEVDLDD